MSAANPLKPSPAPGSDARPYEPSMEEILASIRRIISDDQTLPNRSALRDAPAVDESRSGSSVHHLHRQAGDSQADAAADEIGSTPDEAYSDEHYADAGSTEHSGADDGAEDAAAAETYDADATAYADDMASHGEISAPQFASPSGPLAEGLASDIERQTLAKLQNSFSDLASDEPSTDEGRAESEESAAQYLRRLNHPQMDQRERIEDAISSSHADRLVASMPLVSPTTDQSVASAFNVLAATKLAENSTELLAIARDMIRPMLRVWLDENLPIMVERMVRSEIERVARGGR